MSTTWGLVEWRQRLLAGQPMNGVAPLEVADGLAKSAAATLRSVPELRQTPRMGKELRLTLGDLEAWAHLGNYYAAKIRGATELAMFDKTSKAERREAAVRYLYQALDHWKRYATGYTAQYKPVQLLQPSRVCRYSWTDRQGGAGHLDRTAVAAGHDSRRNWNTAGRHAAPRVSRRSLTCCRRAAPLPARRR